jgi:hypothetical protein
MDMVFSDAQLAFLQNEPELDQKKMTLLQVCMAHAQSLNVALAPQEYRGEIWLMIVPDTGGARLNRAAAGLQAKLGKMLGFCPGMLLGGMGAANLPDRITMSMNSFKTGRLDTEYGHEVVHARLDRELQEGRGGPLNGLATVAKGKGGSLSSHCPEYADYMSFQELHTYAYSLRAEGNQVRGQRRELAEYEHRLDSALAIARQTLELAEGALQAIGQGQFMPYIPQDPGIVFGVVLVRGGQSQLYQIFKDSSLVRLVETDQAEATRRLRPKLEERYRCLVSTAREQIRLYQRAKQLLAQGDIAQATRVAAQAWDTSSQLLG